MKLRTKKSGFTLIEILIVTVIIGILAAIGLVAYSAALRNGRNARRISDLNSIQAAFEQHFTATGGYIAGCGGVMDDSLQGGIPRDPDTNAAYSGAGACTTTTYCICATMEGGSVRGGNSTGTTCGAGTFTSNGSGTHYCVQNRQ